MRWPGKHSSCWVAAVAACFVLAACTVGVRTPDPQARDAAHAAAVRNWMRLSMALARDEGFSPPAVARLAGYLGLTLHLAASPPGAGEHALAGVLRGVQIPAPPPPEADPGIVVPVAAAEVLRQSFATGESIGAVEGLAREQIEKASTALAASSVTVSRRRGEAVAAVVTARAAADGYDKIDDAPYAVVEAAGRWRPTAPGFQSALEPHWGTIDLLLSAEVCPLEPPPAYDLRPGSAFRAGVEEIHRVSAGLDQERRIVADYWNDAPLATATPPGHWFLIAADATERQALSLRATSKVSALVGLALADTAVAVWYWKYHYDLPRPINVVRETIDPDWSPYLVTPPFPEYPSGHSAFSAAAATVLAATTTDEGFVDRVNAEVVGRERRFSSFGQAADEAGMSRVYGGIHFTFGNDGGKRVGRCVGDRALAH